VGDNPFVTDNEQARWRRALAERIGSAYASTSNARVVMIAGSVGRGTADRFSDVEIDVYYDAPPTERERVDAVERSGAKLLRLEEDEDEWEEQLSFDGFVAHTSTFLVATMERYLHEVVDECSVAPDAQTRLFSLLNAITLKGTDEVARWRLKASRYPDGLQRAMLAENLRFGRLTYAAEMLAARDDLLALHELIIETARQVLCCLLAVNRIYLPAPRVLKSMNETIALMETAPAHVSARLKRAIQTRPRDAIKVLRSVVDEVFVVVETHVSGFDTTSYRAELARGRPVFVEPPMGY
jgi:hypothetical protein